VTDQQEPSGVAQRRFCAVDDVRRTGYIDRLSFDRRRGADDLWRHWRRVQSDFGLVAIRIWKCRVEPLRLGVLFGRLGLRSLFFGLRRRSDVVARAGFSGFGRLLWLVGLLRPSATAAGQQNQNQTQ